ncbi:MAG: hypothetical protein MUP98_08390 [Candidatus Aminicenantes bacterium]|nr:hypothetical protein [Candidatus Aminicenantes bacterium]
MKFLKVLTNSLISGLFFSSLLSLLILDLNINLIFQIKAFGQLTLSLFIIYGLFITFLCVLIYFIYQFFSGKRRHVSFISPEFLIVSFSLLIIIYLVIFKANRDFFISFFDLRTLYFLDTQPIFLILFAILGIIILYTYHSSKKKIILWLFPLLFASTMILTIFQRTNFPQPEKKEILANFEAAKIEKKITIIGLEGLSFDFLIPLINEGKLRNFEVLMEQGSWGRLESFSPSEPLMLINSFNTGKFPSKHRQISPFSYHFLGLENQLEVVPRFLFFRQLLRTPILRYEPNPPQVHTKDIWKIFEDNKTTYVKKDWPFNHEIEAPSQKAETTFNYFFEDLKFETDEIFQLVKTALYKDVEFEESVTELKNTLKPQMLYFFLEGLNIAESYFYKYSFPELFGILDQNEINKYSTVIDRYYQFYDQIISKYLASLKMGEELLVVYSPHGTEPLPLWKRFVEWMLGNAEISAYHERAPEGVVFFYGQGVNKGKNISGMKLVDIVPTLLNYLGLPVGKDMDGIVNSSIFLNEFKNPVLYISTYEEIEITPPRK